MEFTNEEYKEFVKLVNGQESRDQVTRIGSRLAMTDFIKKHGNDKCNAMFAKLTEKDRKQTLGS
jgi:hypothetical protein